MASATVPLLTGAAGAATTGYYYAIKLDHNINTRKGKAAWTAKYALLIVGGFAAGRWMGVMLNASMQGTLVDTLLAFPLIAAALLLLIPVMLYHLYVKWL